MTLPRRPSYCPGQQTSHQSAAVEYPQADIPNTEAALKFIKNQQTRAVKELKKDCKNHANSISNKLKALSIESMFGFHHKMISRTREQLSHHLRNGKKLEKELRGMFVSDIAELLRQKSIVGHYEDLMMQIQRKEDKVMADCLRELKVLNRELKVDGPERKLTMKIKLQFEQERNHIRSRYLSECNRLIARLQSTVKTKGAKSTLKTNPWSTKRFQRRKNLSNASRQVLLNWLQKHVEHPHPTEEEKTVLAKRANVSVEQVSNWFVNARVRYLKVEQGSNVLVTKGQQWKEK